jgi:hypothetical protein
MPCSIAAQMVAQMVGTSSSGRSSPRKQAAGNGGNAVDIGVPKKSVSGIRRADTTHPEETFAIKAPSFRSSAGAVFLRKQV